MKNGMPTTNTAGYSSREDGMRVEFLMYTGFWYTPGADRTRILMVEDEGQNRLPTSFGSGLVQTIYPDGLGGVRSGLIDVEP